MAAWIACDLPTAACLQPLYGRPKSTDVLMYENAQRRPTLSNDVNVLWRCICSITLYLSFCSRVFICQAAVNLRNSKSLRLALSRATQASPALMAKASCCPSFLDVLQTFADLMMLRRKGLQQSLREGSNRRPTWNTFFLRALNWRNDVASCCNCYPDCPRSAESISAVSIKIYRHMTYVYIVACARPVQDPLDYACIFVDDISWFILDRIDLRRSLGTFGGCRICSFARSSDSWAGWSSRAASPMEVGTTEKVGNRYGWKWMENRGHLWALERS